MPPSRPPPPPFAPAPCLWFQYNLMSGTQESGCSYSVSDYTEWDGHLFRRFCSKFSESSPSLLGQQCSCSTAQQPGELSENILQNLSEQVAAPPGIITVRWEFSSNLCSMTMSLWGKNTIETKLLFINPNYIAIFEDQVVWWHPWDLVGATCLYFAADSSMKVL